MTDQEKKDNDVFHIQAEKSQINIAKDQAKITANMQVSSTDVKSLQEHSKHFIEWLAKQEKISTEDKEEMKELLETVNQQVEAGDVKKTIVKQLLAKLKEFQPLFIAGSGIGPTVTAITDVLGFFVK